LYNNDDEHILEQDMTSLLRTSNNVRSRRNNHNSQWD
jgi:hypothetical protein